MSPVIPIGLARARNALGLRVIDSPESKLRLVDVISDPNPKTWDAAHSILVGKNARGFPITLWKAVCLVDPTFPKIGPSRDKHGRVIRAWSRIPDQGLICDAIELASAGEQP